jgi:hypothetical protein
MVAAVAAIMVTLGALGIALFNGFVMQMMAQTVFPAATSAFAFRLGGNLDLSARIARNEAWRHSGNVVFVVVAGALGVLASMRAIFSQ